LRELQRIKHRHLDALNALSGNSQLNPASDGLESDWLGGGGNYSGEHLVLGPAAVAAATGLRGAGHAGGVAGAGAFTGAGGTAGGGRAAAAAWEEERPGGDYGPRGPAQFSVASGVMSGGEREYEDASGSCPVSASGSGSGVRFSGGLPPFLAPFGLPVIRDEGEEGDEEAAAAAVRSSGSGGRWRSSNGRIMAPAAPAPAGSRGHLVGGDSSGGGHQARQLPPRPPRPPARGSGGGAGRSILGSSGGGGAAAATAAAAAAAANGGGDPNDESLVGSRSAYFEDGSFSTVFGEGSTVGRTYEG
jgi:hypothetical protein